MSKKMINIDGYVVEDDRITFRQYVPNMVSGVNRYEILAPPRKMVDLLKKIFIRDAGEVLCKSGNKIMVHRTLQDEWWVLGFILDGEVDLPEWNSSYTEASQYEENE